MAYVDIEPGLEYRVPNRLRSDTEESVVGTLWHQKAISALSDMLDDVSDRRGAGWGVCSWVALMGLRHEDWTDYDPRPDIMVLRGPVQGNPSRVRRAVVGAPLFVAEMASDSTKDNDLGDKRGAYAAIGVPEYLIFDPDGDLLPAPVVAWRLRAGAYAPWRAGADGWWRSAALDVAFRPLGTLPVLSVRDRDGAIIEPTGYVRRHLREAERRLRAEERARAEAERRSAEAEEGRAEAERQRAEAERRSVEEERRRAELTRRLAEMEAQLRALRGEGTAGNPDDRS